MKIELTRGYVTVIDDADWKLVCRYKWGINITPKGRKYAVHYYKRKSESGLIAMHRLLCGLAQGDARQVDHRDGDGLNNQRANLRVCTPTENNWNMRMSRRNRSGYKGVCTMGSDRFQASICVYGKSLYLGTFRSAEDAHEAYKKAAIEHFGEFARFA